MSVKMTPSKEPLLVLLLVSSLASVPLTGADNVTFVPAAPVSTDPGFSLQQLNLSTGRQAHIPALLATVDHPTGFVHVFTAGSSSEACGESMNYTSETAAARGCLYAVNGGPFDMNTGACVGDVVSQGTVVMVDDDNAFASWGLARSTGGSHSYSSSSSSSSSSKKEEEGEKEKAKEKKGDEDAWQWVFGDVGSATVAEAGVVELVSGFIGPLLVAGGAPVLSGSALIAPRTAVGVDSSGRLLLLTVDGAEDAKRGMNVSELAIAFASLGAVEAVNLDGGGSTAAWMAGEGVVDRPTCDDNIVHECERAVATVVCVMPGDGDGDGK